MGNKSIWVCCLGAEQPSPDQIADGPSDLAMLKSKLEEARRVEGKGTHPMLRSIIASSTTKQIRGADTCHRISEITGCCSHAGTPYGGRSGN